MDSIFLIIDMQNDYCHRRGFYARRDGSSFCMDAVADKIVDFYHKLKHKEIAVVNFAIEYPEGDNPCIAGSWGAQYYGVEPELKFTKTEFSCFCNEKFCDFLWENRVKKIYICGFQTTFCVYNTLLSSVQHGYETFLVEDLIGEREKHLWKVEEVIGYAKAHAHVCSSTELLESLG